MGILIAAVLLAITKVLFAQVFSSSDVILAEPTTIAIASLALTAAGTGVAAYQGQQSLENSRRMRNAEKGLEDQRRKQLASEAAAREEAARKAASSGQRVGLRSTFSSSVGFASGDTSRGLTGGALFGN